MRLIDLTGRVFGRLTVLRRGDWKQGRVFWFCACECGNTVEVRGKDLRDGKTRSCGCRQGMWKHGHTKDGGWSTPTYNSWAGMRERCRNPKSSSYHLYGGRGITVCERWNSFEAFLADMGERPPGKTLDRIDNDRPYEPGNCRWATPREQNLNRTHLNPAGWEGRARSKTTGRYVKA